MKKKAAISENNVKLIFHIIFAICVIVAVTGVAMHYFKGKVSSEELETEIYSNIVEKCLSKEINGRVYPGIIEEGKQKNFEDCFYVSDVDIYKNIVAIKATLFVDGSSKWSVYFNGEKYIVWANSMTEASSFSRYLVEKNVIYENLSGRTNARLLIDMIYP